MSMEVLPGSSKPGFDHFTMDHRRFFDVHIFVWLRSKDTTSTLALMNACLAVNVSLHATALLVQVLIALHERATSKGAPFTAGKTLDLPSILTPFNGDERLYVDVPRLSTNSDGETFNKMDDETLTTGGLLLHADEVSSSSSKSKTNSRHPVALLTEQNRIAKQEKNMSLDEKNMSLDEKNMSLDEKNMSLD
eukprot:Trichotokara_eunicae@DN1066_c0_g1_i1.p1